MPYANNKDADQPAHPRSLISAFIVHCLDNIIPLVSVSEISSFHIPSVAAQAGFCLTWSQTQKTGFLVTGLNYLKHFYHDYEHISSGIKIKGDNEFNKIALIRQHDVLK